MAAEAAAIVMAACMMSRSIDSYASRGLTLTFVEEANESAIAKN